MSWAGCRQRHANPACRVSGRSPDFSSGLVCRLDVGKGLEEAGVGVLAQLVEAPEAGHAFRHAYPPQGALDLSQVLNSRGL